MKISTTPLPGLLVIEPRVFQDSRGYFFESYNATVFKENGVGVEFLQDNESLSCKGTIRGLHFQAAPFAQGKLVRVLRGSVIDIAVDIRKESPTYGKHFSLTLSEANHLMLWLPIGFAHGFHVLEEDTLFSYKCTNVYDKASENGIFFNDEDLNIDWKIKNPIISEKDLALPLFKFFDSPFEY